ncbi:alpha/beta hydrolase [Azospirillum doebereinerae]|uniref:alpha/beta hydrolase n=1 Tax=Azospirillum doebereinerae TaxID=92933 RepID=UPI00385009C4
MSQLEIISHRPAGPAKPTPLLFVHGAFSAAWIWDAKFLPWFAERGWEVHAVSLRGHGGSEGTDRLHSFGIADYVEDVLEAAGRCSAPPVLIGHSMGGLVVQRALRRRCFPAAVLMASSPPHGLWSSTLGLMWRAPDVYQQMSLLTMFGTSAVSADLIGRSMFAEGMPREEAAKYEPLLQEESRRVLMDIGGWIPLSGAAAPRHPGDGHGGREGSAVPPARRSPPPPARLGSTPSSCPAWAMRSCWSASGTAPPSGSTAGCPRPWRSSPADGPDWFVN